LDNFALNRQVGDAVFHHPPGELRHRLEEHQQSVLAFTTILKRWRSGLGGAAEPAAF